jgi:parvulin-like peptidyl-prolyl isomerase
MTSITELGRSSLQGVSMPSDVLDRSACGTRPQTAWAPRLRSAAVLLIALGLAAGFLVPGLHAPLAPCLGADDPTATAIVVARIDGQPIYRATYLEVLRRAGFDAATVPQERQQISAKVVEELINEQLLARLLDENGVAATPSEVDGMIAKLRSQLTARNQTLETFLSDSGRDEAMLRKQMAIELGLNKLLVPRLTEERLQTYFDNHRQQFDGSRLRVSHILLRPDSAAGSDADRVLMAKGVDIRREIVEGTLSFAEAARRYSVGQSRLRDGDLGFVARQGVLHEAFASQAFRLSEGDVSEPFATPFGVHLVTVTAVEPGRGSFGGARAEVQKQLASEMLREMLTEKRRAATIEYAPGIPHFAEPVGAASGGLRAVVVEPPADGNEGE